MMSGSGMYWRLVDSTKRAGIGGDEEMMTMRNPEAISNQNEAIVALRGDDELFWIFLQSVKVFKQEG